MEYAGGAQTMRPYLRILWGILGMENAEIFHQNIEFNLFHR
jgi:hypothetical protein